MSFPVESFWRLAVEAQLMTLEECHQHHAAWLQAQPQGGDAQVLAEFLVSTNVISRYQASILLAGRAGPFVYGDYRIYERIESGRLAGIFRALHIPSMHRVCLQFLTGEQAASPETVAYLSQMAALISRTSAGFPHLLRCYHLVDLGAFKFFVLEDLLGKRIERVLQQTGALKPGEACRVTRQAALGLSRLHAMHQAHGDVRPQNIWIEQNTTVKMMQFPLSRDPLSPPIDWRKLVAAPPEKIPVEADYIAPELIAGGKPDARSDIYQLGCSLYQMLTNKVPFPADTLRGKLEGHMKGQPIAIEKLNPKVPPELAKHVAYMMQKKPDMRYQQAVSVIEKLLPFMSPAEAQSQPQPPTRASQAYDAWLMQVLQAGAAAPPPPAPGASGVGLPQTAGMAPAPMAAAPMGQPPMGQPPMGQPGMGYGPGGPAPMGAPMHAPMAAQMGPPMGAAPMGPQIGGASSTMAERIAARKRAAMRRNLVLLVVLLVIGGVGFAFRDKIMELVNKPSTPVVATPEPAPTPTPTAVPTATPTPTAAAVKGISVPARDNIAGIGADAMYDSPTAGKTLNLAHMMPGVQMVIALRPAEIVKNPEAAALLDEKVIGPIGPWLTTTLPKLAGTTNDKIEQVLVGIFDGPSSEAVRYSYVVRYLQPVAEAELVAAWGSPPKEMSDTTEFYAKDGNAYYLPKAEGGKVLAVVPKEEIANLLKFVGQPPRLRPEVDIMNLTMTDADRHFTLLYAPYFLEAGGKSLTTGGMSKLMTGYNWLLTGAGLPPLSSAAGDAAAGGMAPPAEEQPKAVMLSAHLTDSLFYEMRLFQSAATPYSDVQAQPLAARMKEIAQRVDDYVFSFNSSPYGRKLLAAFPRMVKFIMGNVRVGTGDKQVVLRGYMPALAAHNVVLGAHVAMIESSGGGLVATTGGSAAPAAPAGPTGVLGLIRTKKMALAFDRNDLNKVLDIVATEIGVPIEMVGPDFQLAGITKNQSMGLQEPEQTIDKLLQTILLKADMAGRLVYTIKPRNPGEEEMIFIATRAGMAQRGEKLLPEFEQTAEKK